MCYPDKQAVLTVEIQTVATQFAPSAVNVHKLEGKCAHPQTHRGINSPPPPVEQNTPHFRRKTPPRLGENTPGFFPPQRGGAFTMVSMNHLAVPIMCVIE